MEPHTHCRCPKNGPPEHAPLRALAKTTEQAADVAALFRSLPGSATPHLTASGTPARALVAASSAPPAHGRASGGDPGRAASPGIAHVREGPLALTLFIHPRTPTMSLALCFLCLPLETRSLWRSLAAAARKP
jgi:hypothetical protein